MCLLGSFIFLPKIIILACLWESLYHRVEQFWIQGFSIADFPLFLIHIKAVFRFDHSMETSGNHWFSYQCRIQKLFWEAGFLTSVARRKTVLQLGGLGGGGAVSPPQYGLGGKAPENFGYLAFCGAQKANKILSVKALK